MVTQFDFGGPGIINKTTDIPVLREYAERLVRKLNWNGPILFDFIRDEHNRYYLLECNPRFWGTTELTIEAGLNVAQMCADLFVLGKPLEKKLEYELDLVYKWVPSCILYWFRSPRSPQRCVARVAQTLRSHGARRTATDLRLKNVPDLLGRALNRLSL
jgi:carbamoylphosphate synthase large subunit